MGRVSENDRVGSGLEVDANTGEELDHLFSIETPWWYSMTPELATVNKKGATSKTITKLAKLDWNVYQIPAGGFVEIDGEQQFIEAPGILHNVRDDLNRIIGTVERRYTILQNHEIPKFMDSVVGTEGAIYESALSLFGGRQVAYCLRLPKEILIAGEKSESITPLLVVENSHDGSRSWGGAITAIRPICQNTLAWAFTSAQRTFKIRHTPNMLTKADEAARVLGLAYDYFDVLAATGDKLIHTKVNDDQIYAWLNEIVPVPEERIIKRKDGKQVKARHRALQQGVQDKILEIYYSPTIEVDGRDVDLGQGHLVGTAWGYVQAVQAYANHFATFRDTREREDERVVVGTYANGNDKFKTVKRVVDEFGRGGSPVENRIRSAIDGDNLGSEAFRQVRSTVEVAG